MRVLIVGAGIAGLTLAALLQQRGEEPVVVERNKPQEGDGYMLGLLPLGGRVLHGLGLYERYLSSSTPMRTYNIGTGRGELLRQYSLQPLVQRYGPIQGIGRDELIELLADKVNQPIQYDTSVAQLEHLDEAVAVTFSSGVTQEFDLVVAADGLHSTIRSKILDASEYQYYDTGWGGWVFWADPETTPLDAYTEYWGAGRFLGFYPTQNRLGVFIGGVADEVQKLGLPQTMRELKSGFKTPIAALDAAPGDTSSAFFWRFHDCRAHAWRKGRVVLLGDSAVGFLPTAGIGASMAMESAAALNDELSRTDALHVEQALDLYEKRHRQRIEKAQTSSRQLGKWMFVKSRPVAWVRNRLLAFYSVEQLVKGIAKVADEPI